MIQINLLPIREAKRRAGVRQQVMQLVFALIVTGGAIAFVHDRINGDTDFAVRRVSQMEHDIKKFQPQLDQVAAFRKKKSNLEKKIDVIEGLDRARSGPVRVLDELATRTPDRLWLTNLQTKNGTIEIKGKSLDNELVAQFLGELVESKYFDGVDLDSTSLGDGKAGGLKLVSFSIRAVMIDPHAPKAKSKKKGKKAKGKKKKKKGGHA